MASSRPTCSKCGFPLKRRESGEPRRIGFRAMEPSTWYCDRCDWRESGAAFKWACSGFDWDSQAVLDALGVDDDIEPVPPPYRQAGWPEFSEALGEISEDVRRRHWDLFGQHGATDDDGTILVLLMTQLASNLFMNAVLGDEMASGKDRQIATRWLDEY